MCVGDHSWPYLESIAFYLITAYHSVVRIPHNAKIIPLVEIFVLISNAALHNPWPWILVLDSAPSWSPRVLENGYVGSKVYVLKIFDEYSQIVRNTKTLSYELRFVKNFDIVMSVYI